MSLSWTENVFKSIVQTMKDYQFSKCMQTL